MSITTATGCVPELKTGKSQSFGFRIWGNKARTGLDLCLLRLLAPVVLECGSEDAGRIRTEFSTTVDPTCFMMEVRGVMCQLVEYWQEL